MQGHWIHFSNIKTWWRSQNKILHFFNIKPLEVNVHRVGKTLSSRNPLLKVILKSKDEV